jgi:acyl-CoA synthetase (AMP-forming)/AMP-acid ligase II
MNIGTLPSRNARHYAERPALIFEHRRFNWRELNGLINQTANALVGLGLEKGDKVALLLPNSIELVALYWAIAKTGLVAVPLSPLLRGPGLVSLLNDSDSVALVTTAGLAPEIDAIRRDLPAIPASRLLVIDAPVPAGFTDYQALVAAAPDREPPPAGVVASDLYNIMYSSGTTGLPKGIMQTHFIRGHYGMIFAGTWRMSRESVVLQAGSLVFNGSMLTFLPWMYLGATLVLQPKFEPGAYIAALRRERATHVMLVPSQIVALLGHPEFTSEAIASLEMLLTVGAPLHREHKERLARLKPGIFYELYGLTEGGSSTVLDRTDYARKPGSVGAPMPLCEMKVVDERGVEVAPGTVGEIIGRGTLIMPGYYKRPELTAQAVRDGWLYTGDLGYFDDEGFLYLVDRKKDMIISGGVNVYPKDIEEVVAQHPAVREVAVFGVPDERWGEAPMAAVILTEPGAIEPDALKEWINDRVAAKYQRVREVSIRTDFPRNTAGKTLKRELRAPYWSARATAI